MNIEATIPREQAAKKFDCLFWFRRSSPSGHLYSPSGPTAEGCFVKSGQTSGPASASADVDVDGDGDESTYLETTFNQWNYDISKGLLK